MKRKITKDWSIDKSWTKEDLKAFKKFVEVRLKTINKKVLDPVTGVIPTLSKSALEDYEKHDLLCYTHVQKWNENMLAEHMWLMGLLVDLHEEVHK
tara:strand:- start:514 stop:801 length:288 start_codon:yes stop_codon:yes gene_type:complete